MVSGKVGRVTGGFVNLFLRELCLQYLCQFTPLGGRREHQHFLHLFYYYFGLIRLLAYQHMLQDVDFYPAQE